MAEAARVIARMPRTVAAGSDTLAATWGGIEIEWHYQPPAGPVSPAAVAAALLAHLAVLDGRDDRKDDPT